MGKYTKVLLPFILTISMMFVPIFAAGPTEKWHRERKGARAHFTIDDTCLDIGFVDTSELTPGSEGPIRIMRIYGGVCGDVPIHLEYISKQEFHWSFSKCWVSTYIEEPCEINEITIEGDITIEWISIPPTYQDIHSFEGVRYNRVYQDAEATLTFSGGEVGSDWANIYHYTASPQEP